MNAALMSMNVHPTLTVSTTWEAIRANATMDMKEMEESAQVRIHATLSHSSEIRAKFLKRERGIGSSFTFLVYSISLKKHLFRVYFMHLGLVSHL